MPKENYKFLHFRSGFGASVQASETNYCIPRDNTGPYTHVEIGFPTAPEPLICGYADEPDRPTETVYGYIPAGLLKALVIKHGGIESGTHPELSMDAEQSAILAETLAIIGEK